MKYRKKKKSFLGFTLIELLMVIGILSVLMAIVLVAVNPLEQINKASDTATKSVAKDVASAAKYYFASNKTLPWEKAVSCRDELATKDRLDQIPSCIKELAGGEEIEEKLTESSEAKEIHVSECSDALAVCYKPKSKTFNKTAEALYTKNGAINPACSTSGDKPDDCYICDFTTNEAKECFDALNPNGTLARSESLSPNDVVPIPERYSKNLCSDPVPGEVSCATKLVTDSAGNGLSSVAAPAGMGPEQFHTAYNLPCTPGGPIQTICATPSTFGPQTIAIVIAYHHPNLEAELEVYNSRFGLPPCTKANGCLRIVNQNGADSPLPSGQDDLWALEVAMDTQAVHGICQTCKILVVETNTNSWNDMSVGVNRAALMGATAISNSWAGAEWSGASAYDANYDHPGTYILAASGDWGAGVYYPAASRHVIGVGGTKLSLYADNFYASETAWWGTGSGCSAYQTAQTFQTSVSNWGSTNCGTKKGINDVSAVADPNTGMAVFSRSYEGITNWWIVGGTSLSTPVVAAALVLTSAPPTNQPGAAYLYANPAKFRDVISGSNGGCSGIMCTAVVGYDGPTGLGSPKMLPDPLRSPTPTPTATPLPTPTPIPEFVKPAPVSTLAASLGAMMVIKWNGTTDNVAVKEYVVYRDEYASYPYPVKDGPKADDRASEYSYGVSYRPNDSHLFTVRAIDISGNYADSQPLRVTAPNTTPTPSLPPTPTPTLSQPAYMRVVYPNGGETFTIGEPIRITWDTNLGTGCNLTYVAQTTGPTWYYNIGNPNAATKYFDWNGEIPATLTSPQNEKIVIVCTGAPQDYSDNYFSVNSPTPTPTPTPVIPCGSTMQTVSLSQSTPILALPGDTVNNILTVKNNDPSNCSMDYTISYGFPYNWVLTGIPASFTLAGTQTKTIPFALTVPGNATAGNYGYQFWVAKQGQTTVNNPVNGSVQVAQVGPTNTPTPTPLNCFRMWSQSMGSLSMSGNAGDTLQQSITITNNNSPGCNDGNFGISYATPTGYIINGLIPPGFTIPAGQSKTVTFTITISSGAQIGNDLLQFWVNNGSNNMDVTVHVLGLYTPPPVQMFSNFTPKMYGNYALIEYSYNATGPVGVRLDLATDPALLNQTSGTSPNARYNYYTTFGSPMDPSNKATPSTIEGVIISSPQYWSAWQCGARIYYRLYKSGDVRIASPIQSGVVDCTTAINVLPWDPWYAAIYQGVYDSRYDADNNGVINYTDYWMLVRATRLR